jgi:serine/threonine protein phosphatase PrpC
MISAKLGIISLFGVFEDIGPCGKMISSLLINYLIDYFEKSKEMIVCLEKNNFYSIMHWSFVNAQKYLIKNAKKYHIDLFNSGCIGTILLIPKNNKNIFYCANSGKCKCILYTNRGIDTLFLTTIIDRASEKERIFNNIKINKI